jgi:amino acid adenylation domain-containing protein
MANDDGIKNGLGTRGVPLDYGGPIDRPFEAFPQSALDGSIIDRFETIVARFPDRLAIRDQSTSLTYWELSTLVARIGAATAAKADRTGPIGILLGRDARYGAAMLGVLASGGAYAALDVDHPAERNRAIVQRAGICAIVSAGALVDQVTTLLPSSIPVIDIDQLADMPAPRRAVRHPAATDLAYIHFTSGSAGIQKGVPHNHRNMLHCTLQYTNSFHLSPEDRLMLVHSPSVSAGSRDIYAALLNGASLHILPPAELQLTGLCREIQARGITIYHSVPTLLRRLAETLVPNDRLNSVRIARLGGDRIEWSDIDACHRCFSRDVHVCIGLSSTETHVRCSWFVDETLRQTSLRPPVGRSLPDRELSIVDEGGTAVADGEPGEMLVRSRYIARGYWNAPDLTAVAFEPDGSDELTTSFRTGDICRRRTDGLIEFVGRKDHQIKLYGNRIEPGEIESALTGLPEVHDAAVIVRRSDIGVPLAVVAYVVLRPGTSGLLSHHLQSILGQRLPRYMVPSQIILVGELPRLSSLKIDRRELTRMDAAQLGGRRSSDTDQSRRPNVNLRPAEPSNKIQEILLKLWRDVLGSPDIGCDDDFLLCGGDSLAAADLLHRIEDELQFSLPLTLLMEAPTVRQLEGRLETGTLRPFNDTIRIHPAGRRRPLFTVAGLYGHAFRFVPILRSLGPDQPCYALQTPGMDWTSVGCSTLPQIATHYVGQIKALQQSGPYRLLGASFGGLVVFEMALQLQRMGESVECLMMLDTIPPTCLVEGVTDSWQSSVNLEPLQYQPDSVEALNLRVAQDHLRMASNYVLDSRSDQNVFRGELTYVYCTGNLVAPRHDRRRLWQRFASRFRLLSLPGLHDFSGREPQYTALHDILRTSLSGEPPPGIGPATVYDRIFRMENRGEREMIHGSMGDLYCIEQDPAQGFVDDVRISAKTIRIGGWAVEPCLREPARTIAVFLDNQFLGYGASGGLRPDVAEYLNAGPAQYAGFDFCLRCRVTAGGMGKPRLFVLSGGRAAELRYSIEPMGLTLQ